MTRKVTIEKTANGYRGIVQDGEPVQLSWDSLPIQPVVAMVEAKTRKAVVAALANV